MTDHLTDIDRRIAEGATSITPDELEAEVAAEREARQRRERARAEASKAERARQDRSTAGERLLERERLARIAELDDLIHSRFGEHEAGIVAAFDAAVQALVPFVEAIVEHNAALREIHGELDALAPLPAELRLSSGRSIHLPAEDVFIHPIDPAQLAAEVVWRAFDAAGQERLAADLARTAGITRDHEAGERYGVPARADGVAGLTGPSDALRRVARIVAERDR